MTTATTPELKTPAPATANTFSIDPDSRVPGLWEISPNEDGTINAVHSMTGQAFTGDLADFNKAMSFKK